MIFLVKNNSQVLIVLFFIILGTTDSGNKKVLTGDLDSSLASLAENLTINKVTQPPP